MERIDYTRLAPPVSVCVLLIAGGLCLFVLTFVPHMVVVTIAGVGCLISRIAAGSAERRAAETARRLGLSYRPRVTGDDLTPYRRLPLFRLTEGHRQKAGDWMAGVIDGRPVVVLDYRFVGRFTPPGAPHVPGLPGRQYLVWPGTQTLVILRPRVELPDFHLAPDDSDWADLATDWSWSMLLGEVLFRFRLAGRMTLLSCRDEEALRGLFRRETREPLSEVSGWTLECADGALMCYIDNHLMTEGELSRALDLAGRTAALLERSMAAAPTPKRTKASEHVQAHRSGEKVAIRLDRRDEE